MGREAFNRLRRLEHELSLVVAALSQWAFERSPEHPGPPMLFALGSQRVIFIQNGWTIWVVRRGGFSDDLLRILTE